MRKKSFISIVIVLFMIALFGCVQNKNIIWNIKEKGEIYSVLFSIDNLKLIFTTSYGLQCNELTNGKKNWIDKEIDLIFSPALLNNELIAGSYKKDNLYIIDIVSGEYTKNINIDENILLSKVEQNNLLYFISRKDKTNYLQVVDLSTKLIKSIFEFKGKIKNSLIVYEDFIIFSTVSSNNRGTIFCVNKNTNKLNWEKDVFDRGVFTEKSFIQANGSLFYIDMQQDIKNRLIEIDIKTGDVIKRIKPKDSDWFPYADYVTNSYIDFDGKNILVSGDKLFVYNLDNGEMTKVLDGSYSAVLNNGKIIYHDNNNVYSFDIEAKTSKEIYKLDGKQLFEMFTEKEFVLLVLADNIKEALADNKYFYYIMLKLNQ